MAYGDITAKDALYRGPNIGQTASWAKGYGDYWVVCYNKPSSNNVVFETYEINPSTGAFGTLVDSLDTSQIYSTAFFIQSISEGVVGAWWKDGGTTDAPGMFTAVKISVTGEITLGGSVEWKGSDPNTLVATSVNAVKVADGIWAFSYGVGTFAGAWTYALWVSTISISSDGDTVSLLSSTQVLASIPGVYNTSIAYHTGTVYVIGDNSTGVWMHTVSISDDGLTIAYIDGNSFAAAGNTWWVLKCGNGWWVCVYSDSDSDGQVGSLEISDAGVIDNAFTGTTEYDTTRGQNAQAYLFGENSGDSYFAIGYLGGGNDQWFQTLKVSSAGAFSKLDQLDWDTHTLYSPEMKQVAYDMFLVNADTNGASGDIYCETLQVEAILHTVTEVNPSSGYQGATISVTISGTGFSNVSEVSFDDGITVNSFTVEAINEITASITIDSDAELGTRDVTVTNNESDATLSDGFTVNSATHYLLQISGLRIPYIDNDGDKQLHVALENLSPDSKIAGQHGEVVVDIGYEVAG